MAVVRCALAARAFYAGRTFCTASASKLVDLAMDEKTGVAVVTMQRPPVNSLNLELLTELSGALEELESTKCRGMVLASASPKVFSAGLDIREMYQPNMERARSFWTMLQNTWLSLYESSFPTVALITGHAPAGGCLLSISCEYRIMLPNLTIGLNETKLGIVAPFWFENVMSSVIGKRQTELALTTGRMFTTDEAFAVKLVDEVLPDKDQAMARANKFLARFAKIPSFARKMTKWTVRRGNIEEFKNKQELDLEMFLSVISQDHVQKDLERYLDALKDK